MTAEIVDFVDKKLEANAILKVYNVNSEEKMFECDLGSKLFRKEGPRTLLVNRDVSVQYEYVRRRPSRLEGYIYLGHDAILSFPRCDARRGQILRFDLKKDTVLVEDRAEKIHPPMKPDLTKLSTWEWIIGGGFAIIFLVWIFWLTYKVAG